MDRDDFQEDCAFSIIYSDNFETLNLVAYSPDEANIWVTGLRCLLDSDKGKRIFSRCFVRPKAGGVWTPYVHPIGEGVLLISSWVKRGSREGACPRMQHSDWGLRPLKLSALPGNFIAPHGQHLYLNSRLNDPGFRSQITTLRD